MIDGYDGHEALPPEGGPLEGGSLESGPPRPLPEAIAPAVEALPGLARVAASAWWHTTEWGVRTSARAGRRVARAVPDPDEAGALARDAGEAVAVFGDLARSVSAGVPLSRALVSAGEWLDELAQPPERPAGEPQPAEDRGGLGGVAGQRCRLVGVGHGPGHPAAGAGGGAHAPLGGVPPGGGGDPGQARQRVDGGGDPLRQPRHPGGGAARRVVLDLGDVVVRDSHQLTPKIHRCRNPPARPMIAPWA